MARGQNQRVSDPKPVGFVAEPSQRAGAEHDPVLRGVIGKRARGRGIARDL
jgi:hypothetical protein